MINCLFYAQTEEDHQIVQNEINSLKVLKHDNIARLLQLIETQDCIYMILEVGLNLSPMRTHLNSIFTLAVLQ